MLDCLSAHVWYLSYDCIREQHWLSVRVPHWLTHYLFSDPPMRGSRTHVGYHDHTNYQTSLTDSKNKYISHLHLTSFMICTLNYLSNQTKPNQRKRNRKFTEATVTLEIFLFHLRTGDRRDKQTRQTDEQTRREQRT